MTKLILNLKPVIEITDEQFFRLSQENENIRLERTAKGELIIMAPAGGETGNRNGRLIQQLFNWADRNVEGIAFDSSTGFKLPNGADRSPDAAWLKLERWNSLTVEQQRKFPPLCPDFVVELLSPSDSLPEAQAKMQEYLDNGARLGWLINRRSQQVEIYRPQQEVEMLDRPLQVSGNPVLLDFALDLASIW
ncbi:MAG: Uma2 family endonuclease [Coleofasciculaceae cyanobacterium SM2_1_6]|nr:Uma2 family endonuclease [Coleofasciculaceae cyanobacterium SM2_1_6]